MSLITILGTSLMGSKDNYYSSRHRLSVIKCECGYEILFLFDLKAMGIAIEKHVLEHKNNGAKDAEANRIEDALIAQFFDKVVENGI
jgi:hypothetical protein